MLNLLCHRNIFVGVLRDTSIPMTPSAFVLSPSETRPFHYVMNILSTMEPLSDEYLDEDQDVNDLYNVSSLQSLIDIYCKIHKINYNMFSISWDLSLHQFFYRPLIWTNKQIELF